MLVQPQHSQGTTGVLLALMTVAQSVIWTTFAKRSSSPSTTARILSRTSCLSNEAMCMTMRSVVMSEIPYRLIASVIYPEPVTRCLGVARRDARYWLD